MHASSSNSTWSFLALTSTVTRASHDAGPMSVHHTVRQFLGPGLRCFSLMAWPVPLIPLREDASFSGIWVSISTSCPWPPHDACSTNFSIFSPMASRSRSISLRIACERCWSSLLRGRGRRPRPLKNLEGSKPSLPVYAMLGPSKGGPGTCTCGTRTLSNEGGKRTKGTMRTSEALPRVVSRKVRK